MGMIALRCPSVNCIRLRLFSFDTNLETLAEIEKFYKEMFGDPIGKCMDCGAEPQFKDEFIMEIQTKSKHVIRMDGKTLTRTWVEGDVVVI